MRKGLWRAALLGLGLLWPAGQAEAGADVGGYFRVAARPDFQGGNGRLGYWNLYGRLMNEGSYGMLDLRMGLVEPRPGSNDIWSSVHARIEGGSIGGADAGLGSLSAFRLSELYVKAGNVLLPGVTWQIGTMYWYQGDLGLYDFRPSNLFWESVGVMARLDTDEVELLVGVGDAGFTMRKEAYNTILTPGGMVRFHLGKVELGAGGQLYIEPQVTGKKDSPHDTPGLVYEDWVRGEVLENYLAENPGRLEEFPDPVPTDSMSWRGFVYLGFGGFGPLIWNNLWVNAVRNHPETYSTELAQGQTIDLFVTGLTDDRYQLNIGNEMQLRIVPERFDITWAAYYGDHWDDDNEGLLPTDHDRTFYSTVIRGQVYLTPTVHWLVETSGAQEISRNGNTYRNHADSVFKVDAEGRPDAEDGLFYGDSDTRTTWQGKTGIVLNPLGKGIFTRPSLRMLYGAQYSTQNNAFGNGFVEDVDAYNDFDNVERHWHHLVSLETEVWF